MIYSIFFSSKIENFQRKIFDIFLIFAQNIDCGYTLEPSRFSYQEKNDIKIDDEKQIKTNVTVTHFSHHLEKMADIKRTSDDIDQLVEKCQRINGNLCDDHSLLGVLLYS